MVERHRHLEDDDDRRIRGLRLHRPGGWPWLVNLLTHASLALELLYPVLIWVKIARPLMLAGVVAMHLGIAVMSPGLTEFALVMIAANLAFVSGPWLRGLATGPDQPALRVLFDGACPRCRASMALITAADPDHVVEPVDLTAVDVRTIHPGLTPRGLHAVDARRLDAPAGSRPGSTPCGRSPPGCRCSGRWR